MKTDSITRFEISIIIPCYNHGHFLKECLTSVYEQTIDQWEVIIVDDASPDAFLIQDVVNQFSDPRVRLIHHTENRGLAASRNTGARNATSPLLLFLDADDLLKPTYCLTTITYLNNNPSMDAVFPAFERFGDQTGVSFDVAYSQRMSDIHRRLRYIVPRAGTTMRREVWEKIGGYCEDEAFRAGLEDRDFWMSSIEHEIRIGNIEQPLYLYRKSAESMSKKMTPCLLHLHKQLVKRHPRLFSDKRLAHQYLAMGAKTVSRYHYENGNRLKAITTALEGLSLQPKNRFFYRIIIKSLMPNLLLSSIKCTAQSGRVERGSNSN